MGRVQYGPAGTGYLQYVLDNLFGKKPISNTSEQIIDASVYLRLLPSDLGSATNLDWIPVDILAEIVGELVSPDLPAGVPETYFNLLNPKTITWADILPNVKARLEVALSAEVQVVPLSQWISSLRDAEASIVHEAAEGASDAANRAQTGLKLVSFFQMLAGLHDNEASSNPDSRLTSGISNSKTIDVHWDLDNALSRSSTFAKLTPVSTAWFDTWLDQWGY